MGIISDEITKEIRSNEFSPNRLITLLGHRYSSLSDVRGAYLHTINVLQRKIYGRYGQKIKHMSVAETGHQHFGSGKGSHIHSVMDCDESILSIEEWMLMIKEVWSKTEIGTGISLVDDMKIAEEKWFKEVYYLDGAVSYCFKNSKSAEQYEYIGMRY
jgi:hypothetical protein